MTAREEAFLREHYVTRGARWCAEQLGMSLKQISRRQQELGIYRKRRWTPADDATLSMLWGSLSIAVIARRMGRTEKTLYHRSQQLGLGLGVPRGGVYLTELARRSGYESATMRIILRWAGVWIRRALTRPGAQRRGRPGAGRLTYFVDLGDGLEAVDRWLAAEYVEPAAKARGLGGDTLRRWLVEAGHERPKRARARWRVPTEVIDQVIATRGRS